MSVCYVLINIVYFSVMTPTELLQSSAVAVVSIVIIEIHSLQNNLFSTVTIIGEAGKSAV